MTSTGVITIELGALADNWRALAARVAPAECGAVVKADGYGLGASRVIPSLRNAGCRTFFVATPGEAVEARSIAPDARIFALDGLGTGAAEAYIANDVRPVLSSCPDVAEWAGLGAAHGRRLPCAIHIDSGLNRLGLSESDVRALSRDTGTLARLDIEYVMSHLACADDPADPKNEEQRRAFDTLRALLPKAPASLAASDGLMLGKAFHYHLVRPGYALYGGQAFKGGETPVKPLLRVQARILQVRDVAPGQSVGYAASWRAQRTSKIAIVAVGYADGFLRSGSHPGPNAGAIVGIGGAKAPIVGRVSMDLITVDVTDVVPSPQRGALVDLVGPGLTIEAMGARAGTIGYEVLTSLSRRFERTYVD